MLNATLRGLPRNEATRCIANASAESHYTLYESGKVRYVSATTRSWTTADEHMRKLIDARDAVKRASIEIEPREAEKAAAQAVLDSEQRWTFRTRGNA